VGNPERAETEGPRQPFEKKKKRDNCPALLAETLRALSAKRKRRKIKLVRDKGRGKKSGLSNRDQDTRSWGGGEIRAEAKRGVGCSREEESVT